MQNTDTGYRMAVVYQIKGRTSGLVLHGQMDRGLAHGSTGGNYLSLGIYPQSQPADEELFETMFHQQGSNFQRKEISNPCDFCEFHNNFFSVKGRIVSEASLSRSDILITLRKNKTEFVPEMGNLLRVPSINVKYSSTDALNSLI